MSERSAYPSKLPLEQETIRAKCFHPSGTFVKFPIEDVETSVPARFEKIVHKYPNRVAVKTVNEIVTYAQLNAMANGLAHALLNERGTDAEPVALLFDNDAALMAAILGVLKAGKFFVLLDPLFPPARIAAVLEDSQVALIVTNTKNVSVVSELPNHRCEILNIDMIVCRPSNENVGLSLTSGSLAAIIYTSGSTGKPKGVLQNQRNILHFTMVRTNALRICHEDRLCLPASGTAGALFPTFVALLNGAMLHPFAIREEGVNRLAPWLIQEEITICYMGSPLFRNFAETLTGKEGFPKLRIIRLASEAACKGDVDIYRKYFSPDCILVNGLSSTETGILAKYLIDQKTQITDSHVPVGYAVEDKDILLLDDNGKEVGINQVGEIVVKSRYLSPGFWRRPDLVEAKFKPPPEGGDKRLYFTGDLGLMLSDGCLIHKGRKDFRVKIRGYGVELAEVEKALREHSDVKDLVVLARQSESGESDLVAYFASHSQSAPNAAELRSFMKGKLPDYMIPSRFVHLDALPLTPNGKVDRKALPDPKPSRPDLQIAFMGPRNSTESILARIWAEVLSLDQVGIHDNFFDLGGHSLAATRVVSQVIKNFQLELPLQSLFQSPTVAAMAAVITEHQGKRLGEEELERMLGDLESLSNEEAQRLLAEQTTSTSGGGKHE